MNQDIPNFISKSSTQKSNDTNDNSLSNYSHQYRDDYDCNSTSSNNLLLYYQNSSRINI